MVVAKAASPRRPPQREVQTDATPKTEMHFLFRPSIPERECRRKSRPRSSPLPQSEYKVACGKPENRANSSSLGVLQQLARRKGNVIVSLHARAARRALQLCGYTAKGLFGQLKRLIRYSVELSFVLPFFLQ